MDLFETLGLGPRQSEENELYVAIYSDPPDDEGIPYDLAPDPATPDMAKRDGAVICSSSGTEGEGSNVADAGPATACHPECARSAATRGGPRAPNAGGAATQPGLPFFFVLRPRAAAHNKHSS
jgi:hypothetical protein